MPSIVARSPFSKLSLNLKDQVKKSCQMLPTNRMNDKSCLTVLHGKDPPKGTKATAASAILDRPKAVERKCESERGQVQMQTCQ